MTLPSSGPISVDDISVELGNPIGTAIGLNNAAIRALAVKPTDGSAIALSDLYGKSAAARVAAYYTFAVHSLNAAPNIAATAGYVAGKTDFYITVNPGIYIWSNSAAPALNIIGGSPGDTITLINNGFIMGKGGNGLAWNDAASVEIPATPGYPAIQIAYPITIDSQNGYIGGGGGAGAGLYSGGGGAGGGIGAYYIAGTGGPGGAIGASGGNGTAPGGEYFGAGGGGGRVIPGVGGVARSVTSSVAAPGVGGTAGGGGGVYTVCGISPGGGGGGWGAAGGSMPWQNDGTVFGTAVSGVGGSAGNAGGNSYFANGASNITTNTFYFPTAGGKAIVTNGKAVTLVGTSAPRIFGIIG